MAGKERSYEKYMHGGKGALVAFEERYIFELNRTNSIFPSRNSLTISIFPIVSRKFIK
jgi:hypothetical protein